MNQVKRGNSYRDRVARLLSGTGMQNVQLEKHMIHKNVDIYFEENGFSSTQKAAVECKFYDRPLTKDFILKHIVLDYETLLENKEVDYVLIVSPYPLSPSASSFVESKSGFRFMTDYVLETKLVDFTSYVHGQRYIFNEEGLENYYISPRISEDTYLFEEIKEWIDNDDNTPKAILAGFGMGKTTFAKKMVSFLAENHISDQSKRIPILIKLGEISNEQALEGLLGKIFTAQNDVRNFTFTSFMELNRLGRLLIILDGFDEMKHLMSWDDFMYNFQQLNRLIVERSKVILLGRPSIFISDSEYYLVLKGIRKKDSKSISDANWVKFDEIEIQEFNDLEVFEFIEKYMLYRFNELGGSAFLKISEEQLLKRIDEIKSIDFGGLLHRPVQAKMLIEVALDFNHQLESFSRYELYDLFITKIIERENSKQTRLKISGSDRRYFIRQVAWWLWCEGESGFVAGEIPMRLIEFISNHYGNNSNQFENDKFLRELLVGSILDKKDGEKYFFPHRSFQEFLVAEYIERNSWTKDNIHLINNVLNSEVSNFLIESPSSDTIFNWVNILQKPKSPLNFNFLDLIANSANGYAFDRDEVHIETPFLGRVCCYLNAANFKNENEVFELLLEWFLDQRSSDIDKVCSLLLLFLIPNKFKYKNAKYFRIISDLILLEVSGTITEIANQTKTNKNAYENNYFIKNLVDCFSSEVDKNKDIIVTFNSYHFLNNTYDYLSSFINFSSIEGEEVKAYKLEFRTADFGLSLFDFLSEQSQENIRGLRPFLAKFFRDNPEPKSIFVPVFSKNDQFPNRPSWLNS